MNQIEKHIDEATERLKLFIEDRGDVKEWHSLKNDLALLRNWADWAARTNKDDQEFKCEICGEDDADWDDFFGELRCYDHQKKGD